MNNKIVIKGARVNNLKNIHLEIPRNKLVVFTGLSGSGKSSLAFDTIYAEGQRKYIESLSSYARQFLGQMDKPDVDSISGLSPAISIDQKSTNHNPRSTVGTITEIQDYLRLLYAKIGHVFCPSCGREIKQQSIDQIVDRIMEKPIGTKIKIMAPIAQQKKGEFQDKFEQFRKDGYLRVEVDSVEYMLDTDDVKLEKNIKHDIYVIVDRIKIDKDKQTRITDSINTALRLNRSLVVVDYSEYREDYSTEYACPDCNISFRELSARLFSFNSPIGACPKCNGLGVIKRPLYKKILKDENLSLEEGALDVTGFHLNITRNHDDFKKLAKKYAFSMKTPVKDLDKKTIDILLKGDAKYGGDYPGLYKLIEYYYSYNSDSLKKSLEKYMQTDVCEECNGARLSKEALSVRINGFNIAELSDLAILELYNFINKVELSEKEQIIASQILKEIKARLLFLINVGLDYLSLSRQADTLSGGESQRIRLASQIGSGLTGVLYVLDEPSIGLHQKDNEMLLKALENLRDLGNSVIVVEHDEDTIKRADYIVDIGPKAGIDGGYLVACGTQNDIISCKDSITGKYLSGEYAINVPDRRRSGNGKFIKIRNAKVHNISELNVDIPLGKFICVTGVSGSGKSSLVENILLNAINSYRNNKSKITDYCNIDGVDNIDNIISIDQSPIGRTPRSNPATYADVFMLIRKLFAETKEAKLRGYTQSHFSFNVQNAGRCENCQGDGILKIEMNFLSDVYVPCEVCHGKRYTREILDIKYKDKNIYDVLEMTIEEALQFFDNIPQIRKKLQALYDVGLGYMKLGQSATTLSGGEAQRLKLASQLWKSGANNTLYILDEPTTGLHTHDVAKLINILNRFVDSGNTVLVIEHNLDIIKVADHIIDMGPDGGFRGGKIVVEGSPEYVSSYDNSYTGKFLKNILHK